MEHSPEKPPCGEPSCTVCNTKTNKTPIEEIDIDKGLPLDHKCKKQSVEEMVNAILPHGWECKERIEESKKLNLTADCLCDPDLQHKRELLTNLIIHHKEELQRVREEVIDEILTKKREYSINPVNDPIVYVSVEDIEKLKAIKQ